MSATENRRDFLSFVTIACVATCVAVSASCESGSSPSSSLGVTRGDLGASVLARHGPRYQTAWALLHKVRSALPRPATSTPA